MAMLATTDHKRQSDRRSKSTRPGGGRKTTARGAARASRVPWVKVLAAGLTVALLVSTGVYVAYLQPGRVRFTICNLDEFPVGGLSHPWIDGKVVGSGPPDGLLPSKRSWKASFGASVGWHQVGIDSSDTPPLGGLTYTKPIRVPAGGQGDFTVVFLANGSRSSDAGTCQGATPLG